MVETKTEINVQTGETVRSFFERDHDRLDEIFKNFQASKNQDAAKAKEYFKAFKFGLQRHIIWEEDILFPVFEKSTGMTQGPTAVMRMEHRQIGDILNAIHDKVRTRTPEQETLETDELEKAILEVLGAHNDKEENILYPMIDQCLDENSREQVFEQMRSIDPSRYECCCSGH